MVQWDRVQLFVLSWVLFLHFYHNMLNIPYPFVLVGIFLRFLWGLIVLECIIISDQWEDRFYRFYFLLLQREVIYWYCWWWVANVISIWWQIINWRYRRLIVWYHCFLFIVWDRNWRRYLLFMWRYLWSMSTCREGGLLFYGFLGFRLRDLILLRRLMRFYLLLLYSILGTISNHDYSHHVALHYYGLLLYDYDITYYYTHN